NSRPVRIGNGAFDQMQHDIWGTMLDSVYLHTKSREQIPATLGPCRNAGRERARGIGDARGEPQHFTSTKIMCWVALDRGAKLAELEGEKSYAQQWRAGAQAVKGDRRANRGVHARRAPTL